MKNKIEMLKTENHCGLSADLVQGVIDKAFGGNDSFLEQFADVASHGGDKGIGFIYYAETDKFYEENKPALLELCEYDADQFHGSSDAHTVCGMLEDFQISKQNDLSIDHWLEFLYGVSQELDLICDEWDHQMMCWILGVYATERTAQTMVDVFENSEEESGE